MTERKSLKLQIIVAISIWFGLQYGSTHAVELGGSPLVMLERDETTVHTGYTSQSYTEALDEGFLPYYRPGDWFMQDNARVHTSSMTREYLERHRT